MVRIVSHQAAACRRRGCATRPQRRFGEPDDRPRGRERHDDHDEQRLRVVDRVVEIVRRRVPAGESGDRDEQHHRPQTEDDLDLAQEVQQLRRDARRRRCALRRRVLGRAGAVRDAPAR